jgi:hypothetical protein
MRHGALRHKKPLACHSGTYKLGAKEHIYTMTPFPSKRDERLGAISTQTVGRGEEIWEKKGPKTQYRNWDKFGAANDQENFHNCSAPSYEVELSSLNHNRGNWCGNALVPAGFRNNPTVIINRGKVMAADTPDASKHFQLGNIHNPPHYTHNAHHQ